jgi:hypothetical protein
MPVQSPHSNTLPIYENVLLQKRVQWQPALVSAGWRAAAPRDEHWRTTSCRTVRERVNSKANQDPPPKALVQSALPKDQPPQALAMHLSYPRSGRYRGGTIGVALQLYLPVEYQPSPHGVPRTSVFRHWLENCGARPASLAASACARSLMRIYKQQQPEGLSTPSDPALSTSIASRSASTQNTIGFAIWDVVDQWCCAWIGDCKLSDRRHGEAGSSNMAVCGDGGDTPVPEQRCECAP